MTSRGFSITARRLAAAALCALLAACSVDNETIGTKPARSDPSEGPLFRDYVAIGTSIGAGIQSGGINDSTQKETYAYQLAVAMGLTPGVDWFYPAMNMPGCPAPYVNPLTGQRVGGVSAAFCGYRNTRFAVALVNNVSVPSIRMAQVLDLTNLAYPATDTLKLAQFLVTSRDPIDIATEIHPTFVTLEMGANDVLGAATRADSTLLTPTASFQASFTAIADSLDHMGAKVAVSNVPDVTVIPHFSLGVIFYCLHNAGCPAPLPPPTLPYSLPTFTVDASCAPSAFGGVGDSMLVTFPATGAITATLAAGRQASLNCGTAVALVATGAGAPSVPAGAVMAKATMKAISARVATFNAYLQAQATTRGWAYADLNTLLLNAKAAGETPSFPNFANPAHLFGSLVPGHPDLISYDGIHPTGAAHRLIAQAFAAVINAKFTTSVTVP